MVDVKLMTAEQLLAMPDDGRRYELVRGELIEMSPTHESHGRREGRLLVRVGNFVYEHRLGEVYPGDAGFQLERDPDTVRAPDVAFVSRDRLRPIDEATGYFPGAPDLAVEIVSPSETAGDVLAKVADYLKAGTRLVWVYYPRTGKLSVFRPDGSLAELGSGDTLSGEDVLPGFAVTVGELFATS